jgi:ADP-ribosylglycohydrolase
MRYSLLSRFRGALLGSFLGEILGGGSESHAFPSKLLLRAFQFKDNNSLETSYIEAQSNWSKIATCGTQSLIQRGRLDLEDWQLEASKIQLDLFKNTASSSEAALATLPVVLFFHDDQAKLRKQLQQAAAHWQSQAEDEGVLAVGYAIASSLTEKINHTCLIPQILSFLGTTQTAIGQQLELVQSLINHNVALETVVSQLRSASIQHKADTAIALAFYCFLSTPEDFRLSLSRASSLNDKSRMISVLTGAISGAYNSKVGIPVSWRLAANKIKISKETQQLTEQLFAVWSGVYDLSIVEPLPWAAIAAPQVIGFR